MPKQVIIENDFLTMWFHPEPGIVHHWFNPNQDKSNSRYRRAYREALEKGVDLLKTHGAYKWLSDDQHFEEQNIEDVRWGQTYWAPKAVVAGWRYWAIVMPDDPIAKMALSHLISKFKEAGVTVQIFPSTDDALTWLTSK